MLHFQFQLQSKCDFIRQRLHFIRVRFLLFLMVFMSLLVSMQADAFTANKVWIEVWPNGIYRVFVNYTVPELQEFREAFVEFHSKAEAEAFYWDVVNGADVYLDNPKQRRFNNQPQQPRPW